MMKKECKGLKRIFLILLTAVILITGLPPVTAEASWYSGDYRYWSQGGSDYGVMRSYGCWIVAQAKLLYETNVERSSSFNPDSYFLWQLNNGQIYSSSNINHADLIPAVTKQSEQEPDKNYVEKQICRNRSHTEIIENNTEASGRKVL